MSNINKVIFDGRISLTPPHPLRKDPQGGGTPLTGSRTPFDRERALAELCWANGYVPATCCTWVGSESPGQAPDSI